MNIFIERAKRGAELLDRVAPGWFKKIDTSTLNMGDCWLCVLGQVYGGYVEGLWEIDKLNSVYHGFSLFSTDEPLWDDLKAAWLPEITERQASNL